MRSLYAMYRKELAHYFVSPVAYVLVGVFLLLAGFFFNFFLSSAIQQSFALEMQSMRFGAPQEFDVPGVVLRAFLGLLSTLVLFLSPMLAMGVYAEERKRGTIELLMTSPITDLEIVLGKFLASLTLYAIMILPTACLVVFLNFRSDPHLPWRLVLIGYAGILLLGSSLLALGSLISSFTENQMIAGVLAFAASLMIWVMDVGRKAEGWKGDLFGYLSLIRHYDDFARGIVDTSALIYYLSFIFLCMFLTVRSLESMRWRRA
ncbi:MAG: ABC transporter permease [Candidatus Acidiferrales bacterium]